MSRAQARAHVAKAVRALALDDSPLRERVAKACPEIGWLESDKNAEASLRDDEREYFDAIRAVSGFAAIMEMPAEDVETLAHDIWMLYDGLTTTAD